MLRTLNLRKRTLETTVILLLLLLPSMLISVKINAVQAYNTGNYGDDNWWLKAHNWVFLNAIELLRKDKFETEADIAGTNYLEDVVNGLTDADEGSNRLPTYWAMGQRLPDDRVVDMRGISLVGNGGGLSHFFDPWSHQGIGAAEDLGLGLYAGGILAGDVTKFLDWTWYFGRNAGEAAMKAYHRAVEAWNLNYQREAMYYLGVVLHLIGDAAGIPFHSANTLTIYNKLFGDFCDHSEYENWVDNDMKAYLGSFSDWKTAVEYGKNPGETGTIYNINWSPDSLDHGIYLDSLKDRSDGIYIAGDPVMTDDDGKFYGHIYQLPHLAEQFIDFAAHESLEWYPLVTSDSEGELESWWEVGNWIEAGHGNLHMKSSTEPLDSRLIFHLNGVGSVDGIIADFEGADHNWEAIDMENSWGTNLGHVEAYAGYMLDHRIGGPWTDEGWLYGGPSPSPAPNTNPPWPYGYNTLQIHTVVNKGLETSDYWDDDCDGWQIAEIRFRSPTDYQGHAYAWNNHIDPLYLRKVGGRDSGWQEQYVTTDGNVGFLKDKVWDDPIPPPADLRPDPSGWGWDATWLPEHLAIRTATIHLLDLSSKLCAGMIKCFFDEVHLPINPPPKTFMCVPEHEGTYVGPSGEVYATTNQLGIKATIGRTVWSDTYKEYVYETVPENVMYQIHYAVDGESHTVQTSPSYTSGIQLSIPDDEKPHTIEFWGTGINTITGETFDEDHHVKTYTVDKSPPTVTLAVGKPSRLIDGVWRVTVDTPITINAIDTSGVKGFYWFIRNGFGTILMPSDFLIPTTVQDWQDCLMYQGPFTLGGKEVTHPILAPLRTSGATGALSTSYQYIKAIMRDLFLGLQPGDYEIGYWCYDNLGHFERKSYVGTNIVNGVEIHYHDYGFLFALDDFIEGVDVKIDPYIQNVQPGSSGTYNVSITNNYEAYNTYDTKLDGLDPTWYTLSQSQITLGPRQTENVTLTISPPYKSLVIGSYKFNVTVSTQKPADLIEPLEKDTQEGVLRLFPDWPTDPEPPGSIELTAPLLIPGQIPFSAQPGFETRTGFRVINSEPLSRDTCIRLKIDTDNVEEGSRAPLGWFNWTRLDIFVPAGQMASIPLKIKIPPDLPLHGIANEIYFDVNAVSLKRFPRASDAMRICLHQDKKPPLTVLKIDDQYTDLSGSIFTTLRSTFKFDASDGDEGVGLATINYRIYNATYDTGWMITNPLTPIRLTGLSDGTYNIDFNSTDKGGNIEPTKTTSVILDNTGPTATIFNPPSGWALQDGVTFIISAIDAGSGVLSVNASIRVADEGEGQPCGFEDLPAAYNAVTGKWTLFFNTVQLPDGYYVILIETDDNLGNKGSLVTVPYSIRNWAVIELLPSTARNKAGRTMPIKFSLRVAAAVDPTQPFVYNEELTIRIHASNNPSTILQTSTYGNGARDYRIDTISEKYITNFKTLTMPEQYTVSVNRESFLIGSFNFQTVA